MIRATGFFVWSLTIAALTGCTAANNVTISSTADYSTRGISFSSAAMDVPAGGVGQILVTANTTYEADVVLHVKSASTDAVAGTDYIALDTDVTLPKGQSSVAVPFVTIDSGALPKTMTVALNITSAQGATVNLGRQSVQIVPGLYRNPVTNASALALGFQHSCVASGTGQIVCLGSNVYGQMGNGATDSDWYTGSQVPVDSSPIELVSRFDHTCALYSGGRLICWGWNAYGQVGPTASVAGDVPYTVENSSTIQHVATGVYYTCVANSAPGSVQCWGDNSYGELGIGNSAAGPTGGPGTAVVGLDASPVIQLSAGQLTTCALLQTGKVYCWGDNTYGQLGNNTTTGSSTPIVPQGLSGGIVQIAVGLVHVCALNSAGQVLCWGDNADGEAGLGSAGTPIEVPTLVPGLSQITAISAGGHHTCALDSNNGVWCWGYNGGGQIGDGTTTSRSSPVEITISESPVSRLVMGYYDSCVIAGPEKSTICWGLNDSNQLSVSRLMDVPRPMQLDALANLTVTDLQIATSPTGTSGNGCAIVTGGQVMCWGDNSNMQLGQIAPLAWLAQPVNVTGLGPSSVLSMGLGAVCALVNAAGLECWGLNTSYLLGNNGALAFTATPTAPIGLPADIVSTSMSSAHACAVSSSGQVYCWGTAGGTGRNGTCSDQEKPLLYAGVSNAKKVVTGTNHSCVLTTDGSVACWGYDDWGQLGDDQTNASCITTPVTPPLDGTAIDIASSQNTVCVLLSNGNVECWGRDDMGQTGRGFVALGISAVAPVVNVASAVEISAGNNHTCARMNDGSVKCWGDNSWAQIGNNDTFSDNASGDYYSVPQSVYGLAAGATALRTGNNMTCAIIQGGYVRCWGEGRYTDYSGALLKSRFLMVTRPQFMTVY